MEYIVLGKDGKEYGPVDADTLQVWVEHGRVFKDTQIRNSLIKKWNEASTLDILKDAFVVHHQYEEAEEGVGDKLKGMLFGKEQDEVVEEEEVRTAFKQRYTPNPASVGQRMGAFLFDSLILCVVGIILFLLMNVYAGTTGLGDFSYGVVAPVEGVAVAEDSAESEDVNFSDEEEAATEIILFSVSEETKDNATKLNNVFYKFFALFVIVVLLYYGVGFGLFAKTLGMHYWGIFIVKGGREEAFAGRAFAFVLAMFAIGIVTPIVVLLNPQHRSIHGYLTGTRLIRIVAKPKI